MLGGRVPVRVVLILFLAAAPLAAQEQSLTTENSLPALMAQLTDVLAEADVPFTPEQERAITLMIEDRRQASEQLFIDLMDFSGGPTSGQDAERLQSAIEWIRDEFLSRLPDYLTPEQITAWTGLEVSSGSLTPGDTEDSNERAGAQTQYVRINNNPFTAEDLGYSSRTRGAAEVIARGGAGTWHGDVEFLFKDDALTARNAFAANKPVYQERQLSVDVGGPVIRDRLTSSMFLTHNESENVDTIHATLPEGVFALGITRPVVRRSLGARSTYQVSDGNSLGFDAQYTTTSRENQGAGGFNLLERASSSSDSAWDFELRQFSLLSSTSVYETRFSLSDGRSATRPSNAAPQIRVLDAFGSGGAQNNSENRSRTYDFGNLYTRLGEKLTVKAGVDGTYRTNRSVSTENFGGTFTFPSLEAFRDGAALTYRVNRGDPLLDANQWELAAFVQNDLVLTPQLTVMLGARYDVQANLTDRNNVAPRVGFAYGIGRATVIRGGAGVFYTYLPIAQVETQRRLDGTRQFEVVIDNASYPDPFESGTLRQTFPSVRLLDPNMDNPYTLAGMISFERAFPSNLFVAAVYDYWREEHQFRLRNLNAPFDSTAPVRRSCRPEQSAETCVRPDPDRGNVVNLQSTGSGIAHALRVRIRQRFGIFNVSADYLLSRARNDGSPRAADLPTDNYNQRADWANRIAPRHTVNGTVNARLPLGIFLTTRISTNTGRYYSIRTGLDDNRDTTINDRPPGVPRNDTRAPKYFNVDFNVSKAFFLSGAGSAGIRRNINVFANMINAFNFLHYGLPSGVLTSPNFGKSTSARQPREIQIGLRFQF